MKKMIKLFILALSFIAQPFMGATHAKENGQNAYSFTFETLTGEALPLSQFKGQVMLIVNTASKCGFTGQYDGLQELYDSYKDRGFVIIGVPSNDFGAQEPGSNEEIATFCKMNYGVTFPMSSKQPVTGDNAHPFYKWVRESLGFGAAPKWNFHKYLINKNGEAVDFYLSTTAPDAEKLKREIELLLKQ